MFPPEVLTFIVTFLLKSLFQWLMARGERKAEIAKLREQRKMKETAGELKDVENARSKISRNMFSWTGAILAVLAFVLIIGVPKIIPLMNHFTEPPRALSVNYVYEQEKRGWLFAGRIDNIQFLETRGVTVLPFETHLITAIAACFFGWKRNKE